MCDRIGRCIMRLVNVHIHLHVFSESKTAHRCVCLHMQVSVNSLKPDIGHLAPTDGTEVYSNVSKQKSYIFADGWKHLWICHSKSVAKSHV